MGVSIAIKLLHKLLHNSLSLLFFLLSFSRMPFKKFTKDSLGSSLKTSETCSGLKGFSSVKYRPISLIKDLVFSSVITLAGDEVELSPNSAMCLLRWCFVRPPFDLQIFSQTSQGNCLFPST